LRISQEKNEDDVLSCLEIDSLKIQEEEVSKQLVHFHQPQFIVFDNGEYGRTKT
jgi:hypothetical protein